MKPPARKKMTLGAAITFIGVLLAQGVIEFVMTMTFDAPQFTPIPTYDMQTLMPSYGLSDAYRTQVAAQATGRVLLNLPTPNRFASVIAIALTQNAAESTPELTETPTPNE